MGTATTGNGQLRDHRIENPMTEIRRLERLLTHVPGVLFQYSKRRDSRHTFPYVSQGIEDILEIPPCMATANAATVLSRIHPDDIRTLVASISDAAENLLTWQSQFRMFSISGQECHIEVTAAPEELPDGSLLWSGYAREVNERTMLEEDLRAAHEDLIRLSEERTQRLIEANAKLSKLNQEIKAEIEERIKLEKNLKESYELLSSLAENLVRSEERERRRIAVELHDNVVQHLALGKLRLDLGLKNGAPFTDLFQEQTHVMVEAMQQIREICNHLSPPVLYDFGLAKAMQSLGNSLAEKYMPHLDLRYELEELALPDYAQAFLYQTARELLINAIKYSKATRLKISLQERESAITLTVEDDGVGFATGSRPGFGLSNIQQRTLFHKGELTITSTKEMKTVVTVKIPAPSPNEKVSQPKSLSVVP